MSAELSAIQSFISKHHVLALATLNIDKPASAPLFYAYNKEENCFIFASSEESAHITNIMQNSSVSAAIYLETERVDKIQGLQIDGIVTLNNNKDNEKHYFKRFKYAKILKSKLWRLTPIKMKLTNNRLGFAKKITWKYDIK